MKMALPERIVRDGKFVTVCDECGDENCRGAMGYDCQYIDEEAD